MWRSLFAGITMALLSGVGFASLRRASRFEWTVAVSYAAMLFLFVLATKLTTAANAIFLQYTAPLHIMLFGRWLLAERPTRLDVGCLIVAFGGMALFFVGRLEADDAAGNLCALGSGVGFALFLTLLRRPECRTETRPRAMVLGNALLAGTALVAVLARRDFAAFTPGPGDTAALLFLGVIQIGLAYVLFSYGIARIRVLEAALIGMLEPVLNPIWVFIVLDERPGWWAVAGGTVIVVAVVARTVASERRRAPIGAVAHA